MGCCLSRGNDQTAADLADLCEELERRLASEGSPHSTVETPPEIRKVVLKNPKTTTLTVAYIKKTMFSSLDFLAKLNQSLDKGRRSQESLRDLLRYFDMENSAETLAKLKASENGGNLFDEIDTEELHEVYNQQKLLVNKLLSRKDEIKTKQSSSKKWRKIWKATYTIAFMAVLTCSVLLAALTLPPAAITAATASATAMKAIEPLFDSLWDEREGDLQSEKKVIKTMRQSCSLAVRDMESIRPLVAKLKIDIGAVMMSVEFMVREEAAVAVQLGMVETRKKMEDVNKGMDELQEKMDTFKDQARRAAAEFLKDISQET
ncbi:UPF0496 protein At4g34320-like [Typha angustifolia]|uniref:UPF0496 protein At4g34320-like n=1 Tax=Typha angustifolia TaxID=59011 RepID=UPI003C2DC930